MPLPVSLLFREQLHPLHRLRAEPCASGGRLKGVEEEAVYLVETVRVLGAKLGALLVQIPPNFARHDGRLSAFLDLVSGARAALEVRHPSWLDPEVFALLEKYGAALVASETDEAPDSRLVRTAPWGYLRLRKTACKPREQIAPDLAKKLSEEAAK